MNKRTIDLTGQKFGKLKVIKDARGGHNQLVWLCRCDCGKEKKVLGADLRRGNVKSCGCWKKERLTKHGFEKHKLKARKQWYNETLKRGRPL